jgi:hypothetical protein
MNGKEIAKNLVIITGIIIFLFICGLVIRIVDPGLFEVANTFFRYVFMIIITSLALSLTYQIYNKSLRQELEEEESKAAEQKDEKQVAFIPSVGVSIFFMFLILLGIYGFIHVIFLLKPDEDVLVWIFGSFFLIGLSFYLWYKTPVLIFADDTVQIKSHLSYLLGIDRRTVIRYADITSLGPNQQIKANMWGVEPKHSIVITVNDGTKQKCSLGWFNSEIVARIYLRFREKLGEKVRLE